MIAAMWAMKTWRLASGLALAGALGVAAGCSSTGGQTAAAGPRSSVLDVTVSDGARSPQTPALGTSPDGYPDFSQPLTAASVQMSDEEAVALQAKLSALASARKSGTISEAEYQRRVEELRKLAAEHGVDVQAALAK
ncbi:hypothetical protein [Ciceribacter thiooxidans]|uniref:Oligomerization/nucleic acid binding protein n=1 Tax=Ciceribacter thiooxidans TaxID=1969821 RepID=A0ABV7I191_9HYPH|nr:hypothetical protein [Ciceribacter thiooxidans]